VLFLNFAEEFSTMTLFKLYIMLLHPLFQLRYRMDPQLSRFYRFLLLYCRIVLLFGISFFTLRGYKNFN
jgi:hypothetical protein